MENIFCEHVWSQNTNLVSLPFEPSKKRNSGLAITVKQNDNLGFTNGTVFCDQVWCGMIISSKYYITRKCVDKFDSKH